VEEIGLFPLGIVLLPGELVPLHIFEPRYRELIAECLDHSSEFGLILADDDGIRAIGTRATVAEVLERFPDGRMDIVVKGTGRFRVVRTAQGRRTFTTADVEPYPDLDEPPPPEEAVARCLEAYRQVVESAGMPAPEADPAARSVAFEVAGHVELGAGVEQELLELRSETARLERVTELLHGVVELVELRRLARERASGNGHLSSNDQG
jgi:Lon protease-like protein